MVSVSKKVSLIIFLAAGGIFIAIGIASIIESNIPRFVQVSEIIKPNQRGLFTPDMNTGNTANIFFIKYYFLIVDFCFMNFSLMNYMNQECITHNNKTS